MVYSSNHKAPIITKALSQPSCRLKVLMEQISYQKVGLRANKTTLFLLLILNFFNHLISVRYLRLWNKSEVKKEFLIKVMALQIANHIPRENYFKPELNLLSLKNKLMIMKRVFLFGRMTLINSIKILIKSLRIIFL